MILILTVASFVSHTFAVVIQIPPIENVSPDINLGSTQVQADESTLFSFIQFINTYLWFFMGAVAMGVLVYGGFKLMTANGDSDKVAEATKLLIGAAIGIAVVLFSYAAVRMLINLI